MELTELASAPGLILIATAFLAAVLSTSIGAGGGLLLLGLAMFMPASAVVPSHAAIMLFGSFFGWGLLRQSVDHEMLAPFVVGSIIGLALALPLLGKLSDQLLTIVLGTFLLVTTWVRLPRSLALSQHYPWLCGLLSSFLSVFVGAMRPMLLAMLSNAFNDHRTVVATVNAFAALQHLGKIVVFLSAGALFLAAWQIIAVLIVVTLVGGWCGRHVLISSGEATLKKAVKLMITGLAGYLLFDALAKS